MLRHPMPDDQKVPLIRPSDTFSHEGRRVKPYLGSNAAAGRDGGSPSRQCTSARISSVGCTRSGTITVCMPAAWAARTPEWESSRARQSAGSTPSRRAAVEVGFGVRLGVYRLVAGDDGLEHFEEPRGAEMADRHAAGATRWRPPSGCRARAARPAAPRTPAFTGTVSAMRLRMMPGTLVEQRHRGRSPHRLRRAARWWPRGWRRPWPYAPSSVIVKPRSAADLEDDGLEDQLGVEERAVHVEDDGFERLQPQMSLWGLVIVAI